MHRHALTDAQWERLSSLLPTKRTGPKTLLTIGLPESLQLDIDAEGSIVDASIVRAHPDAAGVGGFSTKIHVVVDLRGRPPFVTLTPGQRHETTVAEQLIKHAQGRAFVADTAYDSSEPPAPYAGSIGTALWAASADTVADRGFCCLAMHLWPTAVAIHGAIVVCFA